jgi:hypothetical protein
MATRYLATFNDSNGERASSGYYLDGNETDPDGAAAEAMRAALQGMSDAALVRHQLLPVDLVSYGTADAGDLSTAKDKAYFRGKSANGAYLEISVPAPKEAIFQANSEHVDLTHPDVITFTTALLALWRDSANGAVTLVEARRKRSN